MQAQLCLTLCDPMDWSPPGSRQECWSGPPFPCSTDGPPLNSIFKQAGWNSEAKPLLVGKIPTKRGLPSQHQNQPAETYVNEGISPTTANLKPTRVSKSTGGLLKTQIAGPHTPRYDSGELSICISNELLVPLMLLLLGLHFENHCSGPQPWRHIRPTTWELLN